MIHFLSENQLEINYLVNNAGFYLHGPFLETDASREETLLHLQVHTPTKLIRALLPGMSGLPRAGILNVASTGSRVPGPYNAVYCAVKSYLYSLSEALAEELAGTRVTVTTLIPGGTHTAFQDLSSRKNNWFNPMMEAERVAKAGYEALMKGRRRCIPGWHNKVQLAILHLLPASVAVKLAAGSIYRAPD